MNARKASIVTAAIFATGMTLALAMYPHIQDDLNYSLLLRDWLDGAASSPWRGLADTWRLHWLSDNIRLANILFSLSLCLPQWVSGIGLWGCFAAWILLTLRIARPQSRSAWATAGVAALIVLLPYWEGPMAGDCFRYNYIWATALSLWAVRLFIDPRKHGSAAMALWGLAAGWWHEGFALPLLAGMAAVAITRRRDRDRRRLWLMGGIAAGVAILISAPGIWVRHEGWQAGLSLAGLRHMAIPVALAAAIAAAGIRRCGLRSLTAPVPLLLTVSMAASLALTCRFAVARTGWWAVAAAICLITYYMPATRLTRRASIAAAAVAGALTLAATAGAAMAAPLIRRSYAQAARAHDTAPIVTTTLSPLTSPLDALVWRFYYTAVFYPISRDVLGEYHRLGGSVTFTPGDGFPTVEADSLPGSVWVRADYPCGLHRTYLMEPQPWPSQPGDTTRRHALIPGDGRFVWPGARSFSIAPGAGR